MPPYFHYRMKYSPIMSKYKLYFDMAYDKFKPRLQFIIIAQDIEIIILIAMSSAFYHHICLNTLHIIAFNRHFVLPSRTVPGKYLSPLPLIPST